MTSPHVSGSCSLGARVRTAREAVGFTQTKLAAHMGWNDRQTVSALEQGRRSLRPDELVMLGECLGQEVTFFLDPFEIVGEMMTVAWTAQGQQVSLSSGTRMAVGHWLGLWRHFRPVSPSWVVPLLRCDPQVSPARLASVAHAMGHAARALGEEPSLTAWVEQHFQLPVWQVPPTEGWPEGLWCRLPELDVLIVAPSSPEKRETLVAQGVFHVLTDALWRQVRRQPAAVQRLKEAFTQGLLAGWQEAGRPSTTTPWEGPGPQAPGLAQACHQALMNGRVSARKFARTLGLSLQACPTWFAAHHLPPPFDL